MQISGHVVLKGVVMVYNTKFRSNGLELGHMVLKVVNWVHNEKVRSYGIERS